MLACLARVRVDSAKVNQSLANCSRLSLTNSAFHCLANAARGAAKREQRCIGRLLSFKKTVLNVKGAGIVRLRESIASATSAFRACLYIDWSLFGLRIYGGDSPTANRPVPYVGVEFLKLPHSSKRSWRSRN